MLHQVEKGNRPFKRPKNMPTSFEQEIKNLLRDGGGAGSTVGNEHLKTLKKSGEETEQHEKSGVSIKVTPGTEISRYEKLGFYPDGNNNPDTDDRRDIIKAFGLNCISVSASELKRDLKIDPVKNRYLNALLLENDRLFNNIGGNAGNKLLHIPTSYYFIFPNGPLTPGTVKYVPESNISQLKDIFNNQGDINQIAPVYWYFVSDFLSFCLAAFHHQPLSQPTIDKLKPYGFLSSFVESLSTGNSPTKINQRIVDLLEFGQAVGIRSLHAMQYEVENTTQDKAIASQPSDYDRIEKAYDNEISEAKIIFVNTIAQIKQLLSNAKKAIVDAEEERPVEADEATKEFREEIREQVKTLVLNPLLKLQSDNEAMLKLKKEKAKAVAELEKLKRSITQGTVGSALSGPSSTSFMSTTTSSSSNQVSKEDKLQIKKAFELLLPLAVREVFMKFPAYRYGLTIAGKIHLRNEQSVFVTDITDLARLEMENSPSAVTSASMVTSDFVKNLLQRVQTKYISFLKEGGGGGDPVLAQCKLLLTPVMSTVLETCLGEVTKMVSLETNMSIDPDLLLTEEEAGIKKFGTTTSSLFGGMGANQKRIDAHKRLMDKFTSWVATVYISDNQIQKNIATTQSDKQVQNYARLLAMLELRSALRDMGFSVKVNPYASSSMD